MKAITLKIVRKETVSGFFAKFGIIVVALVIFVTFSLLTNNFLTIDNVFNIFKQVAIVAIIAIGMTFVFLIGGMDLSAGSNVLLGAVVTGALITSGVMDAFPAMIVAIVLCAITGLINGFFIEVLHINSVIATLGSQLAIRGLALVIISNYNQWIWMNKDPLLKHINVGKVLGIPVIFIIVIALYLLAYIILTKTSYGKQVYAVGGNEKAAKLCGLNTVRIKVFCYCICGITAGIAGIIAACRLGMVNTNVGTGMEFDAVTAVVLGGASLKGGEANVFKTFTGAIIVGMIANFMTLYGVGPNYKSAVTGAFILLASIINRMTQNETV